MTVVIDTLSRRTTGSSAPGAARPARPSAAGAGDPGPGKPLYKKREPIYPKLVHGPWRTLKWAVLGLLLGVYYVMPWIRWERPGDLPDQAALVDFATGRFYFFGLQLWAQEVYFITGAMIAAALVLYLVTALFGRLWCGYACPQTVWTDLYIAVERLFEGDRNARMRLDRAPLSFNKVWRKGGKHLVWILIALGTGGAWALYFHDAPTLWGQFWTGEAEATAYLSVGVLTGTTYWLAGHMREQVCTYMCPWPRIQGAMLDQDSLQVTYRYDRGEPRGPHKKGQPWEGRGDCIDCKACVVACPMGIDIRNGPQLECINCTLCMDACDDIMARVGRPRGLIGFDTDAAVLARSQGQKAVYRFVRGRTIYYAVALTAVAGIMGWGLFFGRAALDLSVMRDRNPTYVQLKDGSIRNGYTLRLSNKMQQARDLVVAFEGPAGARLQAVGMPDGPITATVESAKVRTVRVFVIVPAAALSDHSTPAAFVLKDAESGAADRVKTVFLSPGESAR
ncbi:MAG TPA: cytochrome c oxidase accessory protein CcoG [Caulobacteraceae bacterium]|nr:cytochrome c oxidase accessory protein CcoG [Caulobacteraceae bacterium]